jgi:hypothetical protein
MGEDLDDGSMMGCCTGDQFLKAIEDIINNRRNSLSIVNDDESGELTWTVNVPANLSGDNITGESNPWNYRRDILPIKNLSNKSLSLILKVYFEIMMEDNGTEKTEEEILEEIRRRVDKTFEEAEEKSGKYFI